MARLTIDFSCEGERLKVRTSEGGAFDHYEYLDFSAGEVTKLCREFLGLLNKATRRGRLDPSLRVQLQSLGQDLYDNLLPLSVKERLQGKEESDLVIHIEDRLVHIPWELLFDGEQFLCRRFNLGRIVTTRQRTPHFQQRKYDPPLSMLLLFDPKGDLPAARQEGMLIRNTLDLYVDRVHISSKTRNIRTDYIRRSIRDFDIVHYAGHATYDTDDPSQSGWLVKEGTVTAALLVKMKGIRPCLLWSSPMHARAARSGSGESTNTLKRRYSGSQMPFSRQGSSTISARSGAFWTSPAPISPMPFTTS